MCTVDRDRGFAGLWRWNLERDKGEMCEDGNRVSGDGCSETCASELGPDGGQLPGVDAGFPGSDAGPSPTVHASADAMMPLQPDTLYAYQVNTGGIVIDGYFLDWDNQGWIEISAPNHYVKDRDDMDADMADVSLRLAARWSEDDELFLALLVTEVLGAY
jgi:cysteine-rich repeat protein